MTKCEKETLFEAAAITTAWVDEFKDMYALDSPRFNFGRGQKVAMIGIIKDLGLFDEYEEWLGKP